MSELLELKISAGFPGGGGDLEPWLCTGHCGKVEGTHASGSPGVCVALVPGGVPVTICIEKDIVASAFIMSVIELWCSWLCQIS